ncbi:hypothetical protein LCGC14_2232400 [marine sediment metagenome]|uniref:Uncharacterized protein n=1 Tax=marine sediment metagenome TaxID=412755 RepID=A0A0F9FKC7_9ZZZZ
MFAVTTSFTPQQVINAARLRHPSLTTLVIDDPDIVNDYNQATRELLSQLVKVKKEALMHETADLVVVGADGGRIDLIFPEGELVGIPTAIEALQSAVRVRVLLRTNIEQREAMVRELVDDTRPGGIIIRDQAQNRWELMEIINWGAVTAISVFATFFPIAVLTASLNIEVLLPFILFGPMTEQLAMQLGHRADLGGDWFEAQAQIVKDSLQSALIEFTL